MQRPRIGRSAAGLAAVYILATVQFAWCYLWLTRAYVNTGLYEQGRERMPFQGRMLMMPLMRWAERSRAMHWLAGPFARSHFWFPRPVAPEVLVQAGIDVACLLVAGLATTRIYQASSRRGLLTEAVYPVFLVVCGATYVMHTVQNFRFVYDLPSLAFFSVALYLIYFHRHWGWFVALFCIATINRETTLLLLPLYMLNATVEAGQQRWRRMLRPEVLAVVAPLALYWIAWQLWVRHHFMHNPSEFYARIDWNLKSLAAPMAWPQLLSAGGYLMLFVALMRRRIEDRRIRAWLWLLPVWLLFMFVYGILIETRVFGELIPLIVCSTLLIVEEILVARVRALPRPLALAAVKAASGEREAA